LIDDVHFARVFVEIEELDRHLNVGVLVVHGPRRRRLDHPGRDGDGDRSQRSYLGDQPSSRYQSRRIGCRNESAAHFVSTKPPRRTAA